MEAIVKPISESTIHQLCSSQVVVDLSTAVKELIENSLDAGATCIELKLKNMGADLIEVVDNGSGIDPTDYSGIAEKHQTSKLRNFEDLVNVASFGFRGEALNALCELSGKFSVSTKRSVDSVGAALSFDRFGRLVNQTVTPRGNGTTVAVEKLFEVLPVRRSEFVRTVKKQYQRMLRILQAYALYSVGTKFIVSNTSNGVRQVVLSTQQSTKLEDNISTLFGAKFLSTILPFHFDVTSEDVNHSNPTERESTLVGDIDNELFSPPTDDEIDSSAPTAKSTAAPTTPTTSSHQQHYATITGFISKVGIGVGRNDNDRQFLFCNGRPVDLPKFIRALNEIWRRYEMKQKPAFIIDVRLPQGSYDINVTPDKREIFMQQEDCIIDKLRQVIDELYAPSRNTFKTSHEFLDTSHLVTTNMETYFTPKKSFMEPIDDTQEQSTPRPANSQSTTEETTTETTMGITSSKATSSATTPVESTTSSRYARLEEEKVFIPSMASSSSSSSSSSSTFHHPTLEVYPKYNNHPVLTSRETIWITPNEEKEQLQPRLMVKKRTAEECITIDDDNTSPSNNPTSNSTKKQQCVASRRGKKLRTTAWKIPEITSSDPSAAAVVSHSLPTLWDQLPANILNRASESSSSTNCANNLRIDEDDTSASASITNTNINKTADLVEDEQYKTLLKQDFLQMQIIGQFNLGFIIARHQQDLFILDQHACDEKYRFEKLQLSTKLHTQPLLLPLTIDTSPSNEAAIIDNLDIFAMNGFKIRVNDTALSGKRIQLLSVPFSQSVQFGVNDVLELASMITDGYHDHVLETRDSSKQYLLLKNDALSAKEDPSSSTTSSRLQKKVMILPKLMATFASRACRSAVMIGTGLQSQEMKKIVTQLSDIEQPWNCPHGRPTMRHLVDMKTLPSMSNITS